MKCEENAQSKQNWHKRFHQRVNEKKREMGWAIVAAVIEKGIVKYIRVEESEAVIDEEITQST